MKQMIHRSLWLAAALSAAGCGKKPAPVAPPPAAPAAVPTPPAVGGGAAERERAERAAAEAAARREADRVRTALEARVFFDYDEADLRADARQILDDKVRVLRDAPAVRLRIEGHADERGSTEYNLALGSRRASAVVNYLAGFGIASTRLETVSFGEERPLAQGRDERAWSQNRRGEFQITAGAP
jgi:peptidoglycan-associated lipoprotein